VGSRMRFLPSWTGIEKSRFSYLHPIGGEVSRSPYDSKDPLMIEDLEAVLGADERADWKLFCLSDFWLLLNCDVACDVSLYNGRKLCPKVYSLEASISRTYSMT